MKKIIILPLLFLGFLSWGQAQFVLQNKTKTEVYNNINTAIDSAVSGDTLYLPGGGFTITNTTIDKTLHWVGQGHYPDSTQATMQTRIISALNFTGTCDNSSFEGILFTSNMTFGSASDEAENISIIRCRIMGALRLRYTNTDTYPSLNFQIIESVTQGINGYKCSNCLVERSQIFGLIESFRQSSFDHNNINIHSSNPFQYCQSCLFTNNVMTDSYGVSLAESNTFNNNIFAGGLPYTETNTNSGTNNIYNVGANSIYIDISHSTYIYNFSYDNNYQLNTSSSGIAESDGSTVSIAGGATDSTNAGIYGTTTPYKTIPYYPHINTATVATEATNDQLGVTINVKAESR